MELTLLKVVIIGYSPRGTRYLLITPTHSLLILSKMPLFGATTKTELTLLKVFIIGYSPWRIWYLLITPYTLGLGFGNSNFRKRSIFSFRNSNIRRTSVEDASPMPTISLLNHREMNPFPTCTRRGIQDESFLHCIRNFEFSRSLWNHILTI
jgi:hypothetical protein